MSITFLKESAFASCMDSAQVVQEIKKAWNLDLKPVHSLPSAYAPKSSLMLFEDNSSRYVLKSVYDAYFTLLTSPEDYSTGIGFFVDTLRNADLPIVNYLPTIESRYHHLIGDQRFVLYPFVEAFSFRARNEEIADTATVHGKMNTVLEILDEPKAIFIREHLRNPFLPRASIEELYQLATGSLEKYEENSSARKQFDQALILASRTKSIFPDDKYQALPSQICHKDIWPANILYHENSKVKVVLDPDEMMHIPRIRDVVYAGWYFATFSEGAREKDFDGEEIRRKVGLYLENYLAYSSLTKEELSKFGQVAVRYHIEDLLSYLQHPGLPGEFSNVINIKMKRIYHTQRALEEGILRF